MEFSKLKSKPWGAIAAALALFIALTMIYFAPQFSGEVLVQHDVQQYKGMSQDILNHRATYGEDPQWEGNMFSGMPAYLINVQYKGTVIKTLSKAFDFLGQPASMIFIAMAAFFFMLLCMGFNPWLGIIPALAYGFSTYFFIIIGAGHITKMMALAFAPMLFGGVYYTYRRNLWLGGALTGVFAAIELGVNHPQITYYFLFILGAFWINELCRAVRQHILPRFAAATGVLLLAGVLAVGSNAGMLYYIHSHSAETMRGGSELSATDGTKPQGLDLQYATAWSYGKAETLNTLIPNLYGGSSQGGFSEDGEVASVLRKYQANPSQLPAYWGPQPMTSGPVYLGAVALLLAVLGLFTLPGRSKWWIFCVTLLTVMLSWGSNFMGLTELFFHHFPMYNKFRTVSMILVVAEWSVPMLMALTLSQLWNREMDRARLFRALKYSVGIVGGIALLFWIAGSALLSFPGAQEEGLPQDIVTAMHSERASMMRADAFRSLLFILLTAGVVWLFAAERIKKALFIVLLGVLVCADMIPVNLRYLNQTAFVPASRAQIRPSEADQQILADSLGEPGFRVMNLAVSPFNDASTSYFHRSIGGYHGAKLHRYQDLIDRHLSKMEMPIYNMLNTRYFIVPDQQSGTLQVQRNDQTNGAAWFVNDLQWVNTPQEEIDALSTLDTRHAAVVDRRFESETTGIAPAADSSATIRMTEYRVNLQRYHYTAPQAGIAVFSEIYYPHGWSAYIDGKEAPYFRADYVLRAMALPAGEHTVEFRFRAPYYDTLTAITRGCSLLLLAALAVALVASFRNRRTNPTTPIE
ncbi:MAG: YfhO family protein [Alistipes sp.]|nr:YfhO family protein [Alistipes sp.]